MEIRIKGQIDQDWSDWMGGLAITHTEQGETVLTGPVPDQAALYGLLSRLADLGLELISVTSPRMTLEKPPETGKETRA